MGSDFGPSWPEVTKLVPYVVSEKRVQKNTFTQISAKGIEQKMGAIAAH